MQENPIQFPTMPSGMSGRLAEARSAAWSRGGYGSKPGSGSDTYGTKPPKGGMSEAEAAHLALLGGSGSPFARDLAQQRQERQEAGILPGEDGGKPAKAAQAYTGLRDDLEAAYDAAVGKPAKGGGFGATVSAPGTSVATGGGGTASMANPYSKDPVGGGTFGANASIPGTQTGGQTFGANASIPGTQTGGQSTLPSGFTGVGAVGGTQAGFGVGGTMNAGNPYSADPVQNQFSTNPAPPPGGAFGGAQGMAGGGMGIGDFRGSTHSGSGGVPTFVNGFHTGYNRPGEGLGGLANIGAIGGPFPGIFRGIGQRYKDRFEDVTGSFF